MQHPVCETSPKAFRFLPGLLLVKEFIAPEQLRQR